MTKSEHLGTGPATPVERINDNLREHVQRLDEWHHKELAEQLYVWADRFNRDFDLKIETPAIQIQSIRSAYGTFRRNRNGFGLQHEITLNTKHLDRPLADILRTLLHELVHEWQQIHGKPSSSNYHNKEFRQEARSFGLVVGPWGHNLGVVPGPFTQLLESHRIDTGALAAPGKAQPPVRRGTSKMKKWSCACTNVRAAVELNAECLSCGHQFELTESAPARQALRLNTKAGSSRSNQ